jgi:RNase P subunit RPR2
MIAKKIKSFICFIIGHSCHSKYYAKIEGRLVKMTTILTCKRCGKEITTITYDPYEKVENIYD